MSAQTPIFSRGSTVLDYWLVHAEGMTVEPSGARVEAVIVGSPIGHAEALIVRSRMTRRRRTIPAEWIAAVEPATGHLLLDAPENGGRLRIPRPSPVRIAAARASAEQVARSTRTRAVGAARSTQAGTRSALSWLRPRALRAGTTTVRHSRSAAARTAAGVAWLAPRVALTARTVAATGVRLTLSAAVFIARGAARATRELGRTAGAAAERGRASLEARRARQQDTPND